LKRLREDLLQVHLEQAAKHECASHQEAGVGHNVMAIATEQPFAGDLRVLRIARRESLHVDVAVQAAQKVHSLEVLLSFPLRVVGQGAGRLIGPCNCVLVLRLRELSVFSIASEKSLNVV
jgi:hypothetical protein